MDSFTTTIYATGPADAPVDEWTLKPQMVNCVIANVATVPVQAPVDEWTLKSQMVNCVIA